jgi:membrane-associated protease RseP (regulator of RpoE activity)
MGADDELDALRRRLYSPDATDADRAAFAAAEAATRAEPEPVPTSVLAPPPPPPPGPPARPLPTRWRLVAIGGATVLVLVGVTAVAVGHPFAPGPVVSSAVPSPALSVIGSIAVPASAQAAFIRDLRAGRDPGLLAYLDAHPATLLQQLRAAGRTDTTGVAGVGPTTLNLAPQVPKDAGHITLVLVTEAAVHFQWTPTTLADANDRSGPERPVANDDGAAVAGEPVAGSVAYSGGVPSRLTLIVPAGVHWGAVVVYTD